MRVGSGISGISRKGTLIPLILVGVSATDALAVSMTVNNPAIRATMLTLSVVVAIVVPTIAAAIPAIALATTVIVTVAVVPAVPVVVSVPAFVTLGLGIGCNRYPQRYKCETCGCDQFGEIHIEILHARASGSRVDSFMRMNGSRSQAVETGKLEGSQRFYTRTTGHIARSSVVVRQLKLQAQR